jgi:hypothetical protein
MKPRYLHYLRLHDEPPLGKLDLIRTLPVKVETLREWFEYCRDLAKQRLWKFELLTIDFNFEKDQSGPWFPSENLDPKIYNADFLEHDTLKQLQWSERLRGIGPNSGLLIGACLTAHVAHRDVPCGIAFHTYHPSMVMRDMSSVMLATQILLACGVDIPVRTLSDTLLTVIDKIQPSWERPFLGLGDAVARFREAFLQRAGAGGTSKAEEPVRLWMDPSSLWTLLDIFRSARSEKELHQKLDWHGLDFYDRNGSLDSLDVRSVFLDRLIDETGLGIHSQLPLRDVKPVGDGQPTAGVIWKFVEILATRTPSNIAPILEFFRRYKNGEETGTINDAVKRKVHRLIALVFAWIDLYAEHWFDSQSRSWDPAEDEVEIGFPPLTEQVEELLRIIELAREEDWRINDEAFDPWQHFLPLAGTRSISSLLRELSLPGSLLYKPLHYEVSDSQQGRQKSVNALQHLVATAVRWGCLEEQRDSQGNHKNCYRLIQKKIPQRRPMKFSQAKLAKRLGFDVEGDKDPSKQLARIIQDAPGFEQVSVRDFLNSLEERPLPDHLKWLGWEFIDQFWGHHSTRTLPYEALPLCLSDMRGASSEAISLSEWGREIERSHHNMVQIQSVIVPPSLRLKEEHCDIQCWHRSLAEIGGDYYRVQPEPPAKYYIFIGDVAGEDLRAALIVEEIHSLFTILEEQGAAPEQVCSQLDSNLGARVSSYGQLDSNPSKPVVRWATFVCALLDLEQHLLTYVNAGHPTPLLVRQDGTSHLLGSPPGEIGPTASGQRYSSETIELSPGDRLVFFTDGLAKDASGGFLQCVLDNRTLEAQALGEMLLKKMLPDDKITDDRTLIVASIN